MHINAEFLYLKARASGFLFFREGDQLKIFPPKGVDISLWTLAIRDVKESILALVPELPYGLMRLGQLDLFGAGGSTPKKKNICAEKNPLYSLSSWICLWFSKNL